MKKLLLLGLLCPLFASAGILEDALLCEKKFTPEQIKTALTEYGNQRYPTGSNRQEFRLKRAISIMGLSFNKGVFAVDEEEDRTIFAVSATNGQAARFANLIKDGMRDGVIKITYWGESITRIECIW